MKLKIILPVVLAPIILFAAWLSFALLTKPELVDLNKCFTGKMNNVKVCPNTPQYARMDEISENLVNAIVISEDAGFWNHGGMDWHELKASFKANLKARGFKRGGSTITQQLIKNVHFSGRKSLTRKVKEALLAVELEAKYSKSSILEKYLNIVEFGPKIYGINAAANHYFSKPPSQLNVLESAFLAFLLPNPKGYYENFQKGELSDFAKKMILLISKRLFFYKKISKEEFLHAKANVDRFPWYGVIDYNYASDEILSLEDMNEESLEDEFQRILEQDIPADTSSENIPLEEKLAE